MLESIGYVLLVFVGLLMTYVTVRLISTAYFKSKREFLRDMQQDVNKGDD